MVVISRAIIRYRVKASFVTYTLDYVQSLLYDLPENLVYTSACVELSFYSIPSRIILIRRDFNNRINIIYKN